MLGDKQIKLLGLRFARSLQAGVRTALVFSAEHQSVERPVQQGFDILNSLLKEPGQFTFGFVDNQVILNNILTTDGSLEQLRKEFLKRGIAAVTFEPGLTASRYKKVVGLLSAPLKAIEEKGSIGSYLDLNEIPGVRFILAATNQRKNDQGDTIIETSSEDYILSKQMGPSESPRDFLDSMDILLESACYDASARGSVLARFAQEGFDGAGYGVPIAMPRLGVVKEGESEGEFPSGTATPAQPGHNIWPNNEHEGGERSRAGDSIAMGAAAGSAVGGDAFGTGERRGTWGPPQSHNGRDFSHSQSEGDVATHQGGFHPGIGSADPRYIQRRPPLRRTPGTDSFIELMESAVERSLLEEQGDPQKSRGALTRILRTVGVEKLLNYFPPERREELRSASPEQLADEYMEDTALLVAGDRLSSGKSDTQAPIVEEEVVRLLTRSLQATHQADRLAQKLSKFLQDYAIPAHVQEKIRAELRWTALNSTKKSAHLMGISKFSFIEFRHLMEFLKELVTAREIDRAVDLATHYFDFLDDEGAEIEAVDLSRAHELIHSIPLTRATFVAKTRERLVRTLLRDDVSILVHLQASNALLVLAQSIATVEVFSEVLAIGTALETSAKRDRQKHESCCGKALRRMIPDNSIERIIEMFLQQRDDSAWARTAAALLRFGVPESIDRVFTHLINEQSARSRLALLRLVTQLGAGVIDVACKYLEDERWYVVRNTCGILAELKDPQLGIHIAPALRHKDARVQEAALRALMKSRSADRGPVLADALRVLPPNLVENALDELTFLKDRASISGLEIYILRNSKVRTAKKAVSVLSGIPGEEALTSLARILNDNKADMEIRRAALQAISKDASSLGKQLVQEFRETKDPLASELRPPS
jgi:HEAT repeats